MSRSFGRPKPPGAPQAEPPQFDPNQIEPARSETAPAGATASAPGAPGDALAADQGARFADGRVLNAIPFSAEIGMRLIWSEGGAARLAIPYDARLIGDPDTGVVHGGVVTVLLDTCCGSAVMSSPTRPQSTATLDLRIDYMRPATPHLVLYAEARCFRETAMISFVRAVAFHETPDEPIATAVGAFMAENRRARSEPAPSAEPAPSTELAPSTEPAP